MFAKALFALTNAKQHRPTHLYAHQPWAFCHFFYTFAIHKMRALSAPTWWGRPHEM